MSASPDPINHDMIAARFLLEAPPPPAGIQATAVTHYIRYKSFALLELGVEAYRGADAFDMPLAEWPEQKLRAIEAGCRQLLDWRGFTPDRPLEHIGVPGFYALLRTFHFECETQALLEGGPPGKLLDRMHMRHVVKGDDLVLFNLVDPQAQRESR